jgi:hypothetical protein
MPDTGLSDSTVKGQWWAWGQWQPHTAPEAEAARFLSGSGGISPLGQFCAMV